MNKQLVAVPGHRDHPPQPTTGGQRVRRVGLLDRAALHLGVALITWGRRPVRAVRPERPAVARPADQRDLAARREASSLWGSDLTRIR